MPKRENKKVIGLMKDESGGAIMKEFGGLRAKTYSYLKDNKDKDKKSKGTYLPLTKNLNLKIIKTV